MSFCRSIVSDRCSSVSNPIIQRKRNSTVTPSQTNMMICGEVSLPSPNIAPNNPPVKLIVPSMTAPAPMKMASTAPSPPVRRH